MTAETPQGLAARLQLELRQARRDRYRAEGRAVPDLAELDRVRAAESAAFTAWAAAWRAARQERRGAAL